MIAHHSDQSVHPPRTHEILGLKITDLRFHVGELGLARPVQRCGLPHDLYEQDRTRTKQRDDTTSAEIRREIHCGPPSLPAV